MGQAGSTDGGPMGAMEALQQQLDRLEQNLTSLEEDYAERVAGELLDGSKEPSGDLYLCGARLKCDGAVRVVTGPVVGLVGSTTARILLEVDADAEVAFAACLVDKNCPGGRETRRGAATLKANRPGVCELTGLTPDSRFVVVLGNVHRSDAVERLCEFCTYERAGKREEARARFIAVAHDRPTAVRPGEYNRWETIVERVSMRQLPPVNVMVHVGGQVEMRRFFEEAWVMLKRGVEQRSLAAALSGATEPWHELEKRACDRLRDGYRFAWNLPGKRDVLSHCPHLMLCGEGDVYPRFTDALELSPGVGGEVASTMLRLARRVFWEYQRQLWDSRVPPRARGGASGAAVAKAQLVAARAAATLKAANVDLEVYRKRALQSEEGASSTAEQTLVFRCTELEAEVRGADADVDKAVEELKFYAENDETPGGSEQESSLHVAVLLLDTRWSQVTPEGAQLPTAPLVPSSAWAQLENLLLFDAASRDCTALLVAVEEPPLNPYTPVAKDPAKRKKLEDDVEDFAARWSKNEADQKKFMGLLLKWLHVSKQRCMYVLAGGDQPGGVETYVEETTGTQAEFRQMIVGSITGAQPAAERASAAPLLLGGALKLDEAKEHLAFEHERLVPADHCAYVEGLVVMPNTGVDPVRIQAESQSLFYGGVRVHKQIVYLAGKRVHAFRFDDLEAARYYAVHFDGIEDPKYRTGSFTTPARINDPAQAEETTSEEGSKYGGAQVGDGGGSLRTPWQRKFRVMALARDAPYPDHENCVLAPPEPPPDEGAVFTRAAKKKAKRKADFQKAAISGAQLMECAKELSDAPWPGVDLHVHLGGQVDMDMVLGDAVAVLARAEMAHVRGDPVQAGRLEDAALDRLRDGYRTHWNLPGTREMLARGSHVMLRGDKDFGTLLMREGSPITSLERGMMRVYREYQRQLWDPLPNCAAAAVSAAERHLDNGASGTHQRLWGGNRALGKGGTSWPPMEVPLVGDDQWDALEEALSTEGLRALYVASDCPFLDNSINDAKYKMTQPEQRDVCHTWPAHGGDLLRLLGLLEDWEAEAYERRVFFLAGGATCGLDTELISKRLSNAADDATAAALREAKEREDAEAKEKEEAAKVETEEEKKRKEREKKKAERGGAFAKMRAKAAGAYLRVQGRESDRERRASHLHTDFNETSTRAIDPSKDRPNRRVCRSVASAHRSIRAQVSNAAKAMKQDAGGAVGPRKLKLWQSGPITAEASPPTFELQGGLGRDYAYAHAATREQCVATCTAAWSEFETMFTTHVITPGVEPGKPGRGVLPKPRRPEWLKQLLVFPDEALFDGEKDAVLQQYLDTELVKRDLMHMFDMVGPGHGEREAAGAYAAALYPVLSLYYREHAPSQIRDLAPLPSTLLIEVVGHRWNSEGLSDSTVMTTLPFLSPETFAVFVGHCLQFANMVRGRVLEAVAEKKDDEGKEEDDPFGLGVCGACQVRLAPYQHAWAESRSNATRSNAVADASDSFTRYCNSPLRFTLGGEVRKAAYTLRNLFDGVNFWERDAEYFDQNVAHADALLFVTLAKVAFIGGVTGGTGLLVAAARRLLVRALRRARLLRRLHGRGAHVYVRDRVNTLLRRARTPAEILCGTRRGAARPLYDALDRYYAERVDRYLDDVFERRTTRSSSRDAHSMTFNPRRATTARPSTRASREASSGVARLGAGAVGDSLLRPRDRPSTDLSKSFREELVLDDDDEDPLEKPAGSCNAMARLAAVALLLALHARAGDVLVNPIVGHEVRLDGGSTPTPKTSNATAPALPVVPPAMPESVRAFVYRDWSALDEGIDDVLRRMGAMSAFVEFPHARNTFFNHLKGTYGMLMAWNQPVAVARAGLAHTAYSGDLFEFFIFDPTVDRAEMRALVGGPAEALIYEFGTVARHEFVGLGAMMNNRSHRLARPLIGGLDDRVATRSRVEGAKTLSNREVADLIVVSIADYLDQGVTTNGWRDHHQIDPLDTRIFPGTVEPDVSLYWAAAACKAVRDHLAVIPPIFDRCTADIAYEDEAAARDMYWRVVQDANRISGDAAVAMIAAAIELLPYVGEMHVLLAQLHFRAGRHGEARDHAAVALDRMYAFGGTWDKRLTYESWIAFARLLFARSTAALDADFDGDTLPRAAGDHNVNDFGTQLVSIPELISKLP
ncbi:hypothetical protein JL722_5560 [Aureococcus anophagefferens]|nr:hypothetical protein JL722_5560 [Aureococcus anophagefferens]